MTSRYCALWLMLGVLTALHPALSAQAMAQTEAPATPAARVLYPIGSRLGLAPPPGMVPSRAFPGFEDRSNNVYIRLLVLPASTYEEAIKNMSPEIILGQLGATLERRDDVTLANGGSGVMAVMRQETGGIHLHKWMLVAPIADITAMVTFEIPDNVQEHYPEAVIRAALLSTAARAEVPAEEMLELVPFRLSELAGLRVLRVVPGVAVELTDAAADIFDRGRLQMRVSASPGGPTDPQDRDKFARLALRRLPPLRGVRVINSEPLRIVGQAGHELRAEAKDPTTGQSLQIVQWLRFGSGGYLQIIGFATTDHWPDAFTRFRTIRDGILPR